MTQVPGRLWSEVSPYLDEALELDPQQHESWLATLEATQPALAAELRELLALHATNRASGFMERSPLRSEESLADEQIGPYTIERLLGRGGMGSVWLARRSDGKFEGRVAIKLLDRRGLGRDAAEQIRHEASLLARLSHPHIARLFDAGVRQNGQPYLILEYVAGERIDRYCASRQLSLPARLRLFLGVLDAGAHAHAQLIVHRDLKPSNVLVTPDGVAKLLDFGVAALQPLRESAGGPSAQGTQALTPGYAAPEQLRGEPVSAASDVYALGVLLYLLVTGHHPYGSSEATPTQLIRATLTGEPSLASERIAGAAERRRIRGDLDAIIARALSAEPAQRYATAAEFAADIRAFLGKFPVRARPATRAYVIRKFAQRHWGGVLSVLLTLLVLIGGSVITTVQMFEVRRQRDFARSALARAETLKELDNYVLMDAAPAGKPFTVNDLLGRAANLLERAHMNDADRAALLRSIGFKYAMQDEDKTGLRLLRKSYQLSLGVADPSVRALTACSLAEVLSRGATASHPDLLVAQALRELPAGAEFALDRSFCLLRGSAVARNNGDSRVAIERARAAIEALAAVPFDHELAELRAYADLGEAYRAGGRYQEAIAVFERIWPRLVALGRDDTITAVTWLNNWGMAAGQLGRPLEAEALLRRSIEIHRADSSDAAVSPMVLTNYAQQLYDLARTDEARGYAETAYREAVRAGDETVVNQTLLRLARIYRAQQQYARATAMLDEAEPRLHAVLPAGHYAFASLACERALVAEGQHDTRKALELMNEAIELVERSAGGGKAGVQLLPSLLKERASIEMAAGQLPAAERDAREAVTLLPAAAPPGDFSSSSGRAYLTLARILISEGKLSEARAAGREAVLQLTRSLGPDHPETRAAVELSH